MEMREEWNKRGVDLPLPLEKLDSWLGMTGWTVG